LCGAVGKCSGGYSGATFLQLIDTIGHGMASLFAAQLYQQACFDALVNVASFHLAPITSYPLA